MHAGEARHLVTDQLVEQEHRPARCRPAHQQGGKRQVVSHGQGHQQLGVDPVGDHVQCTVKFQIGGRPGHQDRLACAVHAAAGIEHALDPVIAQALAEQVGEVQAQATANGVEVEQAKNAQHLGAAVDFHKLPLVERGVQCAGETLEANPRWRTGPVAIDVHMKVVAGDAGGKAPVLQHRGQVAATQAPLIPALAVTRHPFPTARTFKQHAFEPQVEAGQADAAAVGPNVERPGTQQLRALVKLANNDVQRRYFTRVDRRQRIRGVVVRHHLGVGGRQANGLHIDHNRRVFRIRQGHCTNGLLAVDLQRPGGGDALHDQTHLIQLGAEGNQLADFKVRTAEQLLGTATRVIAGITLHQRLPGGYVEFRQHTANTQALGSRQYRGTTAQKQLAAPVFELAVGRGKGQVGQITVVKPVTPFGTLQGHTEHTVATFIGRQPKGRRQINHRPLEAGADPQLAVGTVEGELQLIRQIAAYRDRLIELEPVRELFHPHLTAGHYPGADTTGLAIGKNLRGDRAIERPRTDALAAQALGTVEAKIALELGQLKLGFTDFQAGLVGAEVHQDFRLHAFFQRDIQVNAALERTFALPARKGFGGANGGFLKDFQAVAQPAIKIPVQKQMADLACWHMRDVDGHVAHLGVEQLAFAGHDPHAAVFDKHVARDIAHMGPARLERQFGAMHLEK